MGASDLEPDRGAQVPFLARYAAQGVVIAAVVFAVDHWLLGGSIAESAYLAGAAGLFMPLLSLRKRSAGNS